MDVGGDHRVHGYECSSDAWLGWIGNRVGRQLCVPWEACRRHGIDVRWFQWLILGDWLLTFGEMLEVGWFMVLMCVEVLVGLGWVL